MLKVFGSQFTLLPFRVSDGVLFHTWTITLSVSQAVRSGQWLLYPAVDSVGRGSTRRHTSRATPPEEGTVTGCFGSFRTGIALPCAVPGFLIWAPCKLLQLPF